MTATWDLLLTRERAKHLDNSPIVACTLSDDEMHVEFYEGYGGSNGAPFTAWSGRRVYFPVVYDGAEWVGSAPRDPCDEAMIHVGGE